MSYYSIKPTSAKRWELRMDTGKWQNRNGSTKYLGKDTKRESRTQHIGVFATKKRAERAKDSILKNPELIGAYKNWSKKKFTPDFEDEIMSYFWTHIENSDATIAELFNITQGQASNIIIRRVREHFDYINRRGDIEIKIK